MSWGEAVAMALFPATMLSLYFYFMWMDQEGSKENEDERL